MAERIKNMREVLLQAGIGEINEHGVNEFSIRRVADTCGVSCAAPYKHFKDKRDFIAAVIDYVNSKWIARRDELRRVEPESPPHPGDRLWFCSVV